MSSDEKEFGRPGGHGISSDNARPVGKSTTRPDATAPITHLYLTFDTELPTVPTLPEPGVPNSTTIPPCPDLASYISPFKWGAARKNVHLLLSCVATFLTAYSAGSYSPPSALMASDFGVGHIAVLVGITVFCMGFALAPMALAPLSELWGRYPIFVVAGVVYVVFTAVCSVMPDLAGMLVARFFVGAGASVFSAVVGGVIADLWSKEERNVAMSLFSGSVLAGTGAGPLVAAALIQTVDDGTRAWKWTFWHQVILDGVLVVTLIVLFKETRGSVVLRRKANRLNEWYEELEKAGIYGLSISDPENSAAHSNPYSSDSTLQPGSADTPVTDEEKVAPNGIRRIRWSIKEDEQRASLGKLVIVSVRRPFEMLLTEPVVFCFSIWAAFSWGILYLSFAVVPFLYGTDLNMSSRVYAAMMAAAVVATIAGIWQEQLLKHPQWRKQLPGEAPYTDSKFWAFMRRKFPAEAPEARLYFACITAMLLPAGLFGAFLSPSGMGGHSVAVGVGFATWGIYSVYLATFNYLADTYTVYASSALAAQSFCRNVLGGCFPLVTSAMFSNMGLRGAGGMLGAISTGLTVIPWVLVFFGARIRARSTFSVSLQQGS